MLISARPPPPKKILTITCLTQIAKCHNDLQLKISPRYLRPWQHTVSAVFTYCSRQPLSKWETMWGTWSLLTQCLNDSILQIQRRWASSRDLYEPTASVYSLEGSNGQRDKTTKGCAALCENIKVDYLRPGDSLKLLWNWPYCWGMLRQDRQ